MPGEHSALLALQRATHVTLHRLGTALAGLRLTAAELNVLGNLAGRGSLSVGQLAAATGTRPSTLTSVLDRLDSRGYLRRELDPSDRRSFRLVLTEQGHAAAGQVAAAVADLERRALGRLPASQVAGFRAVLSALQEEDTDDA